MGAIVTCPLEVVKTRLQSSNSGFGGPRTSAQAPGPPSSTSSSSAARTSLRQIVVLSPEVAAEQRLTGPLQTTVQVAAMHKRASSTQNTANKSSSTQNLKHSRPYQTQFARLTSSSSVPLGRPQQPSTMGVLQCLK